MSSNQVFKCHFCGGRTGHTVHTCASCRHLGHANVGSLVDCPECVKLWNEKAERSESLTGERSVQFPMPSTNGRPVN